MVENNADPAQSLPDILLDAVQCFVEEVSALGNVIPGHHPPPPRLPFVAGTRRK